MHMMTAMEYALEQAMDLVPSPEDNMIEAEERTMLSLHDGRTIEEVLADGLKGIGAYVEDAPSAVDVLFDTQPMQFN
jgi:hypothetical protein